MDVNESRGHELLIAATAHYVHGDDMQSNALKSLITQIAVERNRPGNWQWAITATSWNADLLSYYF
jgi:hypothetical protein